MSDLFVLGYLENGGAGAQHRVFAVAQAPPLRLVVPAGPPGSRLTYHAFQSGGRLLNSRELCDLIVHAVGFPIPGRASTSHVVHWVWSDYPIPNTRQAGLSLPLGMQISPRRRTMDRVVCVAFVPASEPAAGRGIYLVEPNDQFSALRTLFDLLAEATGRGPPVPGGTLAKVLSQGFGVPLDDEAYRGAAETLSDDFRCGIQSVLANDLTGNRVEIEPLGGEWRWRFRGPHAKSGAEVLYRLPTGTAAVTAESRGALRAALTPGAPLQIAVLTPQPSGAPWVCTEVRRADEFLLAKLL